MAKRNATKRKATRKAPAKRKAAKKRTTKRKVAKKRAAKRPARKKAAKKKAAKKKVKRKPNPSFMRPWQPDAALGSIVGNKALPRTEVVKKLWAYIRRNGLQDTQNKRMINADDRLRDVFGGRKQVSMFEMTKLVSRHLN